MSFYAKWRGEAVKVRWTTEDVPGHGAVFVGIDAAGDHVTGKESELERDSRGIVRLTLGEFQLAKIASEDRRRHKAQARPMVTAG